MQHLVYKCPKCQNTLLVSNKMLHDLRCTEENPATYENFISQQPQPSLEESTRKSNNFNTPQRFSRRMSIKHHDGTMTDFRKEKNMKGKEELVAIKYDPQGNVISRKKADNFEFDEYNDEINGDNEEVSDFYNADVNYDPEKYYEVNEENERKYNNMNNMNNYVNNNQVIINNNQVIYETAIPQEYVYEAPAVYDQNVTINQPIEETIINHDPHLSHSALDDIIRSTMHGTNNNNNLGNLFNNVNINEYNPFQSNNINTSNVFNQSYNINSFNPGNSDIFSQGINSNSINVNMGNNDILRRTAGIGSNDYNNMQYQYPF